MHTPSVDSSSGYAGVYTQVNEHMVADPASAIFLSMGWKKYGAVSHY